VDYLQGRISLDEAIYHAETRTRQYAKRQMTWFRKEIGVCWFNGFGGSPEIQSQVCEYVSRELGL
jgi:tRNA dimethylallyltransferase